MQPLQRTHLLLLLALLVLCVPLGQADNAVTTAAPISNTPMSSLSPPCGSPPLLSLALGLAAAFFLGLR